MRCSSCEPLLDAYLEAALRRFEARAVTSHLRTCTDCTALLDELRVVDALLATARSPSVAPDFTATVVSATRETATHAKRRLPLGVALLLYLAVTWALALVALRYNDAAALASSALTAGTGGLTALGAAVRALAPVTPVAAAAVTGVLLVDVLLIVALFFGYRRVRPILSLYLSREERS